MKKEKNILKNLLLVLGIVLISFLLAFISTNNLTGNVVSDISSGLVGFYSFEGNILDSTTNKYDGLASAGITYPAGKFGKSARFHGTNPDDYISLNKNYQNLNIFSGNSWTISTWIKPTDGVDAKQTIFNGVWHTPRIDYLRDTQKIRLSFYNSAGTYLDCVTSNKIVEKNKWTYVSITAEGGVYTIYINGIKDASKNCGLISANPVSEYRFGKLPTPESNRFGGLLDELRIYNRVLNLIEIKSLMEAGSIEICNGDSKDEDGDGKIDEFRCFFSANYGEMLSGDVHVPLYSIMDKLFDISSILCTEDPRVLSYLDDYSEHELSKCIFYFTGTEYSYTKVYFLYKSENIVMGIILRNLFDYWYKEDGSNNPAFILDRVNDGFYNQGEFTNKQVAQKFFDYQKEYFLGEPISFVFNGKYYKAYFVTRDNVQFLVFLTTQPKFREIACYDPKSPGTSLYCDNKIKELFVEEYINNNYIVMDPIQPAN